jgi:hypothetical protein
VRQELRESGLVADGKIAAIRTAQRRAAVVIPKDKISMVVNVDGAGVTFVAQMKQADLQSAALKRLKMLLKKLRAAWGRAAGREDDVVVHHAVVGIEDRLHVKIPQQIMKPIRFPFHELGNIVDEADGHSLVGGNLRFQFHVSRRTVLPPLSAVNLGSFWQRLRVKRISLTT